MPNFKYRLIVNHIIDEIEREQIKGKLMSVRELAKIRGVGVSTVVQAYYELEKQGWIEARPKVGYFVINKKSITPPNYGKKINYIQAGLSLNKAVQFSFNDPNILPLSCTAPSSVIDNELLLNRLHKKALKHRPYQLIMQDPIEGLPSLRQAITQHLAKSNQIFKPEQILINNGRRDGLMTALIATQTLTGPIAIESPMSFFFQSILKQINANVIEIPIQERYQDELNLLSTAYQLQPFKTYLINPNFADPTGRVLSNKDKLALIQWAEKHEVTIIEYDRGELHFGTHRPCSIASLVTPNSHCRIITLSDFYDTLSHTINLGYLICTNTLDPCLFAKQIISEEPNLCLQYMMIELMQSKQFAQLMRQLHTRLKANYTSALSLLLPSFNQINRADFYYSQVAGGPCLWIKLPDHLSSETLWEQAIAAKLSIAPGAMFSFNQDYQSFFRITFALPWDRQMEAGVKRLGELILAYTRA
ncbi:PLP-dependent aminotransferase family protein [uncultured Shewanella sp.]|uniref:aminotransferase-like domain-containing protein n=1 Tax=uncultured Shewanella sp. TaxID=173975 RepID=UPI002615E6C0|nr:PLP-dependent aminotransferase family protein [uncultured Shewanella sp.]